MTFLEVALESFIDMSHELVQLSKAIDWAEVESEFSGYYCSDNGRPGVPIRKMVGLMLLKNIYDLSDEEVVARWMENPYMQYFTGETVFRKRASIEPVIGHRKSVHGMIRNYLRGTLGDAVNTLLAAAAYNLRLWMNKLPHTSFVSCLLNLVRWLENLILENQQQYPRLRSVLATAAK